MTATIPNLWEGKFSQHAVSPLAVFRTHAGNFDSQAGGLLRAEVEHRIEQREGKELRVITFDIIAQSLDYRQGVLIAEHPDPGAYPVALRTTFINGEDDVAVRICHSQADLVNTLGEISKSSNLLTLIESLFAQINEANAEDD